MTSRIIVMNNRQFGIDYLFFLFCQDGKSPKNTSSNKKPMVFDQNDGDGSDSSDDSDDDDDDDDDDSDDSR